MTCQTDTLTMGCHYEGCDYEIGRTIRHDVHLSPSKVIAMHEQMIRHVEREHVTAPKVPDPVERALKPGDRVHASPCEVTVRIVDGDLARGHCIVCNDDHLLSAEAYNEGRGPWNEVVT